MSEHVVDGMGSIPVEGGTAFRVWAPHADSVAVIGDFNDWSTDADPLEHEGNGYWYTFVEGAQHGQEYKYRLTNGDQELYRIDPYALEVTNSVGNGRIYDHGTFDWGDDGGYQVPSHNRLVIYEMHVGSFFAEGDGVGTLETVAQQLDRLQRLGVNAIQVMPVTEFAGDCSWGYNPAHIFAVESAYGGPDALKTLVREAHRHGISVIQDVVYNHFGPSDLDLWQFDGWSENGKGGIYFYNDDRSSTPWGDTRPDYGREEVRRFIRDNALMWLREYRVDGLRVDMTPYMRSVDGFGWDIPDGWSLQRWINESVQEEFPGRITIAEDLHGHDTVVGLEDEGAGFSAQWDAEFVHPIRAALVAMGDEERHVPDIVAAISHSYDNDAFRRVIYTESHDEVANGSARVPHEIDPGNASGWAPQKRSTLGAAIVLTAPGIPMLFQGQEFLEGGWFRDDVPLDWNRGEDFQGIALMYRDLIDLRLNRSQVTMGLQGHGLNVFHANNDMNVIAFQRWADHGPGDDVVVVLNLAHEERNGYRIGMPAAGLWKLRFNSDARAYSALFGEHEAFDVDAAEGEYDGLGHYADVSIAPYSVLVYSQDA